MDTFADQELRPELDDLRKSLCRKPEYAGKLAPVFYGYAPETFKNAKIKILFIGKATAGAAGPEEYGEIYACKKSAFWYFARTLSDRVGGIHAWTNLCKIGTLKGNPGKRLAEDQADLAVRILQAEIGHLGPSLIVCVAANSAYDDFLYRALGTKRGSDSDGFIARRRRDGEVWVRPGMAGSPPVLWMKHPERTPRDYQAFAILEALALLGLSDS